MAGSHSPFDRRLWKKYHWVRLDGQRRLYTFPRVVTQLIQTPGCFQKCIWARPNLSTVVFLEVPLLSKSVGENKAFELWRKSAPFLLKLKPNHLQLNVVHLQSAGLKLFKSGPATFGLYGLHFCPGAAPFLPSLH